MIYAYKTLPIPNCYTLLHFFDEIPCYKKPELHEDFVETVSKMQYSGRLRTFW